MKIDKKQKDTTALKTAILDIAKCLKGVFNKYSPLTRERAWEKIKSKEGSEQVNKLIRNPQGPLNTFPQLVTKTFKEWLEEMTTLEREKYRRSVTKAIESLKTTAPEIFEFDTNGEPKKISASFEELKTKLEDRGLIPDGTSSERFVANVKRWMNLPVEDRDLMFLSPHGEGVEIQDIEKWQLMREKHWGAFKTRRRTLGENKK